MHPIDNPPPYEAGSSNVDQPSKAVDVDHAPVDAKIPKGPEMPLPQPYVNAAGPSYTTSTASGPIVYHYVHPVTHAHIASFLPPDHPEMLCLQAGAHVPHSTYGFLGILAAVFWFPLGIGLCLLDRRVKCTRCGAVLDEGCM